MYIYEGHLGGFYTSDEPLDYDDLYCETCGDSDTELCNANTMSEAWDYFKDEVVLFDPYKCLDCCYADEDEGCYYPNDERCKECVNYKNQFPHGWGYSFQKVMEFLEGSFNYDSKPIYVMTIITHNDRILAVDDKQLIIPTVFCIDEQYINLCVGNEQIWESKWESLPKFVKKHTFKDKIIYYYLVRDISKDVRDDVATYQGDGWVSYCKYDNLSNETKQLLEPIKDLILINQKEIKYE